MGKNLNLHPLNIRFPNEIILKMDRQRAAMLLLLTENSSIFMCMCIIKSCKIPNMHNKDLRGLIQTSNTSKLKTITV